MTRIRRGGDRDGAPDRPAAEGEHPGDGVDRRAVQLPDHRSGDAAIPARRSTTSSITDDPELHSAADLRFVERHEDLRLRDRGLPSTPAPTTDLVIEDPTNGIDIPAGEQIVHRDHRRARRHARRT